MYVYILHAFSPRASHVGNFKVALNNNKKKKGAKGSISGKCSPD